MKPVPDFSPHKKFSGFIKTSHRISHIFGLFVFLIEVPLVAWVKFWDVSMNAAIASSVTMIPFLIGFVIFYWCFNFEYKSQIYKSRQNAIDEVEKRYLSRLSIDMSSIVQEEEAGLGRRHSIHADVSPPTPDMARRKYHSMHDIHLESVQE